MSKLNHIRNFSIIAHIDHGKSTLADRFIQHCEGLSAREMQAQVLDSMDIERERGITIKAQSVTLDYKALDGETYQLNFIDTPGHVDFSYEVSRSLAACEGALLVVDAAQGVEAQSVANCYTAIEQGLEVVPVLNKMDLPQADPDRVAAEIEEIIGIDASEAVRCSAKSGLNVEGDPYLGVVSLVRITNGTLRKGDKIRMKTTGRDHGADGVGIFTPKRTPTGVLRAGEVGYMVAGIKDIHGAPVGDTITHTKTPDVTSLPGFQKVKPQVYAGLFPISSDDFENFRDALDKLSLNDASLFFEPESSDALGFGFRCGFLGMLHMEIIQERLEREYNLDLITTAPTVIYQVINRKGETIEIDNPSKLPDPGTIEEMHEPIADVSILVPQEFLGNVISLCVGKRGMQKDMQYVGKQVSLTYQIPMAEVVMDFFDRLKSVSRGFASLDYSFSHFSPAPLTRLDILINGERVDALAVILHTDNVRTRGRALTEKMKELIPRQMFDVAIQAAMGANVVARTNIKAMRKNVTAKCYGGDISRKKKLLQKQKDGKKRMKQIGNVEIPQSAFLAVLKVDD